MKALALTLCVMSAAAQAQDRQGCTDAIEQALRAARPQNTPLGEVAAQHCKSWPPSGSRTLAA